MVRYRVFWKQALTACFVFSSSIFSCLSIFFVRPLHTYWSAFRSRSSSVCSEACTFNLAIILFLIITYKVLISLSSSSSNNLLSGCSIYPAAYRIKLPTVCNCLYVICTVFSVTPFQSSNTWNVNVFVGILMVVIKPICVISRVMLFIGMIWWILEVISARRNHLFSFSV